MPRKNTGAAALLAVIMGAMPAAAKTIVYVSNADSREISVLELDAAARQLKQIGRASCRERVL